MEKTKKDDHKIGKIKSVKIVVETDNDKEEFASKKPCAVVASTFEKEGDTPIRAAIQMVGKVNDIFFAYHLLTNHLIEKFGEKQVVKIFTHALEKEIEKTRRRETLEKMIASGKKGTIN